MKKTVASCDEKKELYSVHRQTTVKKSNIQERFLTLRPFFSRLLPKPGIWHGTSRDYLVTITTLGFRAGVGVV